MTVSGAQQAGGTTAMLVLPGARLAYQETGSGPAVVNDLLNQFLDGLAAPEAGAAGQRINEPQGGPR